MSVIVVGVDDSEGAKAALHFALAEAQLRSATVHAVHAWTPPALGEASGMLPMLLNDLRQGHEETLDRVLADALGAEHAAAVERRVVQDTPARALVEAAADADLLVVGSRGRGGFAGLLLGSVSQQCAQHAPCPVVIVPSGSRG